MQSFSAIRIARTATIRLAAPPEVVFPLFGPLEERRWEPSWNPTFLYPPSGATQRDAVFTATHTDGTPSFWTIVVYEPAEYRISYVRMHPATHVARIDISCAGASDATTRAQITYTFTGLSAQGNAYVETFTEVHYTGWLHLWEAAINHYLRHGAAIAHHGHV